LGFFFFESEIFCTFFFFEFSHFQGWFFHGFFARFLFSLTLEDLVFLVYHTSTTLGSILSTLLSAKNIITIIKYKQTNMCAHIMLSKEAKQTNRKFRGLNLYSLVQSLQLQISQRDQIQQTLPMSTTAKSVAAKKGKASVPPQAEVLLDDTFMRELEQCVDFQRFGFAAVNSQR
jgi:hypothetical protein